jgi:hypothetical protein
MSAEAAEDIVVDEVAADEVEEGDEETEVTDLSNRYVCGFFRSPMIISS